MREIILQIVNGKGVVRAVELALDVMGKVNPSRFETETYRRELDELIRIGDVLELRYVLFETDCIQYIY